jgi:hypothetical protein
VRASITDTSSSEAALTAAAPHQDDADRGRKLATPDQAARLHARPPEVAGDQTSRRIVADDREDVRVAAEECGLRQGVGDHSAAAGEVVGVAQPHLRKVEAVDDQRVVDHAEPETDDPAVAHEGEF